MQPPYLGAARGLPSLSEPLKCLLSLFTALPGLPGVQPYGPNILPCVCIPNPVSLPAGPGPCPSLYLVPSVPSVPSVPFSFFPLSCLLLVQIRSGRDLSFFLFFFQMPFNTLLGGAVPLTMPRLILTPPCDRPPRWARRQRTLRTCKSRIGISLFPFASKPS